MRILAIETSCPQGSVALVEDGRLIAQRAREQHRAHAEGIPVLIDELMADSGWHPSSLDRLAAGIGPGSFTGLRMGLALLVGIAQGLDRPLVGIGSLRAMAAAVPMERNGLRCSLVDARREEIFVAAYTAQGGEMLAPCAVPRVALADYLRDRLPAPLILVGQVSEVSTPGLESHRDPESDLPHALWVARCALTATLDEGPLRPIYVREAVADVPLLPPNPLRRAQG